jgi:hypothetical protein
MNINDFIMLYNIISTVIARLFDTFYQQKKNVRSREKQRKNYN